MEQTQPKSQRFPLLSMVFGITAPVLLAVFLVLYHHPVYSGMFSEWSEEPFGLLIAVSAILGGSALTALAAVFGIIGLIKEIRRQPRNRKSIIFSIVGLVGAGVFAVLLLLQYYSLLRF